MHTKNYDRNRFYTSLLSMLCMTVWIMGSCTLSDRGVPDIDDGYDAAYEKSVIRLEKPVIIDLSVNNRPGKASLRSFPGYEENELTAATINTEALDRVANISISELNAEDYEIISGTGTPIASADKIKDIPSTEKEPKLKLKAIPVSGIITIYANVRDEFALTGDEKGENYLYNNTTNDRTTPIDNDNHIIDFERKGGWRIVADGYTTGSRNITKNVLPLDQGTNTLRRIPMSVRLFNCAALDGTLYAAYRPEQEVGKMKMIYLQRAFALLELTFQTKRPDDADFRYESYMIFNYPFYFSYLYGDYSDLKIASGFNLSEGTGFDYNVSQNKFFKDKVDPKLILLLPENDPQTDDEQLKLRLRVAYNLKLGSYWSRKTKDLPIGVRQPNGLLKITRNELYKATIKVYPDGAVGVYYKIEPFVKKEVDVVPFE